MASQLRYIMRWRKNRMITSNLKAVMEAKGITLKRMAEDTKLAEMTLIRARGQKIGQCKLDTLAIMARYLGVRTRDLYDEN